MPRSIWVAALTHVEANIENRAHTQSAANTKVAREEANDVRDILLRNVNSLGLSSSAYPLGQYNYQEVERTP